TCTEVTSVLSRCAIKREGLGRDRNQRLGRRQDFSEFDSGHASGIQSTDQFHTVLSGDRDQQPTRGLWIEENCLYFFRDSRFVVHHAFGKIAIGFQAARDAPSTNALQSTL